MLSGAAPVQHEGLESALWLTRRAHEHDDAVVTRANRAVTILIVLVSLVAGAATAPVLEGPLTYLVLGPMAMVALVLVVAPGAQMRLWFLRGIRPSFTDTVVRSPTPSSL